MRQLLRLNVIQGTGKNAEVKGYEVGGKTGTAEKPSRGGYRQKALISSFVGMFPMSEPKFLIVVSLDEPKGIAETGGYATGGMVSAPSVKAIIENIVSLYGILPGDWNGNPAPLEIASTPIACQPTAAAARVGERATVAACRSARRCRPAPADRTRRPRRECVALLLSELMGDGERLAARSGPGRPDARLPQGPARLSLRRPRRLEGRWRELRRRCR